MFPTEKQVDTYFNYLEAERHPISNALLNDAKADLNTILGATDKPIPAAESLAGMVLEAALELTFRKGGPGPPSPTT